MFRFGLFSASRAGAFVCFLCATLMGSALFAQDARLRAPLERIAIGPDQTLRSFVATHLNDPDLWPYVLQLNKIASPADVAPGQVFELPVQQVAAADDALSRSLEAIQKANAEGAQVFAPTQIGNAIDSRESAITERETGSFAASVDLSDIAVVLAAEALEIAIAQRDRSAEAVVSDVHGAVEGRAPKDSRWSDRGLNDILVEFERVRTLSDSTTQITFRDLSRLRLNANSNATIQRMRSDPLTGGEVTKVSLVNGDFYALLNQLSGKTSFEVDVPGVETTTNSGDFWIKNDQTGARFVNYDTPALEVVADGATTLVRENEGVVLTSAGTQRTQVLDAPRLALPAEGAIIYTATAQLGWDEFEGARAYWVEVASDPGFNDMRVSEWGIEGTAFETPDLPPRVYHWRVAALDELGLPGQWSKAQPFTVRVDTTPPFLALLSPEPNLLSDQPQVEVFGASEPDATVLLNGAPVTLGTDGSFIEVVTLTPGQNLIRLEAVDPAGNTSNAAQAVVYRPKVAVTITLAPTLPRVGTALATRSAEMTVTAASSAAPGARVEVRGAGGVLAAETVVGPAGDISFTLPASAAETTYEITVLSPTGAVEGRAPVSVLRDQTPPVLTLDAPLPPATDVDTVDVSGDAGDAVALTLGGQDVPLTGGRFEATVTLEPGQNGFDLIASDAVGNVAATRLSTLYDIDPPEILRTDLSRPSGSSGPIVIEAEATDASGLRQAASYLIEVSGVEREGWLRCDNATGLCTATLPPEPGDLRLIEIVIEDYAGNAAFN